MSASLEQGALGPESGPSETVAILYTNWRGETAVRRITPIAREWFGSSDWHPEPQWLFTAFDMDKEAFRDFARSGVKAWGQAAVDAALSASAPASGAERMTAGEGRERLARTVYDGWLKHGIAKPDFVTWEDFPLVSPEDYACCFAVADAIIASGLTPAPATPPGVPDSVRALIEKLVAMSTAWGIFSDERGFASGLMLEAANILATHPAGQSAGSGAEIERLRSVLDFEKRSHRIVKAELARIRQQLEVQPAPDSTRTGDEGTVTVPSEPTEEMMAAGAPFTDDFHSVAADAYRAMIAARPASPEAWKRTGKSTHPIAGSGVTDEWFRSSDGVLQNFPRWFNPNSGRYEGITITSASSASSGQEG